MELRNWIFYGILVSIGIWVILKAMGYINTPVPLEVYPYIAALFGAGMFYQKFLGMEIDVSQLKKYMSSIKSNIKVMDKEISYLKNDVDQMKAAIS